MTTQEINDYITTMLETGVGEAIAELETDPESGRDEIYYLLDNYYLAGRALEQWLELLKSSGGTA